MESARPTSADPVTLMSIAALCAVLGLALFNSRLVIEMSRVDFLVVTCFLGGWAATMTGRAIAKTWRPYWHVVFYMALLAAVVRWVHWALFQGTLRSLQYYLVDFVVVLACASLGYRLVRAYQMSTQYRWLYRRSGPFGWARATGNS